MSGSVWMELLAQGLACRHVDGFDPRSGLCRLCGGPSPAAMRAVADAVEWHYTDGALRPVLDHIRNTAAASE